MDRGGETQAATDPDLVQKRLAEEELVECLVEDLPRDAEVLLRVSWVFPTDQAAQQGQPDYLDGSCLIFAEERLLDVVDFRGAHSAAVGCHGQKTSSATYEWSAGRGKAAGVLHSGDVMSSDGGTHVIRLRLADLPPCATDCFFAISAYNCRNLSKFQSLNVRLLDAETPTRVHARLATRDVPAHASCVVVCGLRRRLDRWMVRDVGRACAATVRDYSPVEATIAPFQDDHVRWRRRKAIMMLAHLIHLGRAHDAQQPLVDSLSAPHRGEDDASSSSSSSCSSCSRPSKRRRIVGKRRPTTEQEADDVIGPLLALPVSLFHAIVQYL